VFDSEILDRENENCLWIDWGLILLTLMWLTLIILPAQWIINARYL